MALGTTPKGGKKGSAAPKVSAKVTFLPYESLQGQWCSKDVLDMSVKCWISFFYVCGVRLHVYVCVCTNIASLTTSGKTKEKLSTVHSLVVAMQAVVAAKRGFNGPYVSLSAKDTILPAMLVLDKHVKENVAVVSRGKWITKLCSLVWQIIPSSLSLMLFFVLCFCLACWCVCGNRLV